MAHLYNKDYLRYAHFTRPESQKSAAYNCHCYGLMVLNKGREEREAGIFCSFLTVLDFGRAAILSRKWDRLVSRLKSRKSEFGPEWALNAFFSAFRFP
ncbi:MAG: hypothetical protein J5I94_25175, partial [Phaeodactylibacter sp.]|nr:hypothetical protein [Phaeodactylibacter sp.]